MAKAKKAVKKAAKKATRKAAPKRKRAGKPATSAVAVARAAARSVSGKSSAGISKPHVARAGDPVRIGVLGGSGIYGMAGLKNTKWRKVSTPWGDPSDELLFGTLDGAELVFLPRHGRGHVHSPSEVNYRANIDALKRVGCQDVISVSACGSFKEQLAPGTFVIVDQFIDRTFMRQKSFFSTGMVAHVSCGHPVCSRLGDALETAAKDAGITVQRGGTYLCMEGPQFSTQAESFLYKSWGCDVIGMTNAPEAKLAREAELCYASVAMVTDYDCWHPDHDHVDVAAVIRVLLGNAEKGQNLVAKAVPHLKSRPGHCPQGCDHVLDTALITAPEKRDPKVLKKLDAVAGRVLKA
ncbi:S-methyl-5'-thioadenosine phosphorylase [Ferrovibrio sp.]|uniref:S-methyl-5'-thioadenosine phosphorylase n=1 Tax=Ferrovibrio sp. TaxID=1917215 RepID=UPI000CAF431E|nr:S-methyl-5'-thioadenosine phosphorylase [Ferrovibrio sp.]PJI37973.1 MAG: S-methyl-5'-thioadenosine phosphorylase [Ferrovibrio sp.]